MKSSSRLPGALSIKEEQRWSIGKYEDLQFYYHADHLGSSRYITDAGGAVYQHVEYLPFGETLVAGRAGAERTRYLYNGQELDAETGLYYYGARYYDPRISMFYGVDPRAEKYPGISPYAYCANSPVVLVDPDGREWYESEGGARTWKDGNDPHVTVNGDRFNNIGASTSLSDGDGGYINYYQNVPISASNAPVNAEDAVLGNVGLTGQLLGNNSPLSAGSQAGLMAEGVRRGQEDFLSHPVTQITIESILFVATGGIEGTAFVASAGKSLLTGGARGAVKESSKVLIRFGKMENQVYHTFRHTDALGLDRSLVQSTIRKHFSQVSSKAVAGKPFNQVVRIGNQRVQYAAFKLPDGSFNIGRIHAVK